MSTIFLVRHGHVDNPDNIFYDRNIPLSPQGAQEMIALAEDIKEQFGTPSSIISSPYLRTRESAEVIAHIFTTPEVKFDDRLIEWQVGDWIGKPLEEFRRFAGYHDDPFSPNFEGLETYSEMAERVIEVIREIAQSLEADEVSIIVAHREPLASAILRLRNQPDTDMRKIDLPKGSAWKIEFDGERVVSVEKSFDHSSKES